jgi:membrane-bound serine protease (ClpP class)
MVSGTRTLDTENLAIVRQQPDWRTSLLSVITDPNVAYFLMIIGFYGIIFELANPGSLYPGVIGAICLVLALFAFQVLSVNYAGLALILLGLAFIVGEAFMPSFGMLGVGGIVAFVLGSVILMDGSHQAISLPAVGGTAAVAGGFILWTVTRFMGLRRKAPAVGAEHMAEERCQALDDFSSDGDYYRGHVRLSGERWNAISDDAIVTGQWLRVQSLEGLTVKVIPVQKDHSRKEAL